MFLQITIHLDKMYRYIPDHNHLEFAQKALKPNGQIWFEINEKFGKETAELCREKGFKNVEIIKDFKGKERVVRAQV